MVAIVRMLNDQGPFMAMPTSKFVVADLAGAYVRLRPACRRSALSVRGWALQTETGELLGWALRTMTIPNNSAGALHR